MGQVMIEKENMSMKNIILPSLRNKGCVLLCAWHFPSPTRDVC